MIKRILAQAGIVGLAVLLSLVSTIPMQEASAGGTCTQEDLDNGWACISDRPGLEQITNNLAGKYKLAGDIDLSVGGDWTPLGIYSTQPFTGEFDGNGYVISGMTITGTASNIGLFAYTEGASIRNVRLIDVDIDVSGDADDVGGLAGHAAGGTRIENSLVTGSVKAFSSGGQTSRYVGGLIGDATGARIYHSSFYGTVEGNEDVGGMFGYGLQMEAYYSNSTGKVIGDINVGGFIGKLEGTNRIEDSYAAAEVELHGGSPGPARGFHAVSGFTTFSSNYWDSALYPTNNAGATGQTTLDMKKAATYGNWDFPGQWTLIQDASYPVPPQWLGDISLNSLTVTDVTGGRNVGIAIGYEADNGYYRFPVVYDTDEIKLEFNHLTTSDITVAYRTVGSVPTDAADHYPEYAYQPAGWSTASPATVAGVPSTSDTSVTVPIGAAHTQVQIVVRAQGGGPESVYKLTVVRGDGSSDYPHNISTADQLAAIGTGGYGLDDHYVLIDDIDVSGYVNWTPVGPFAGRFDGNDHAISHLTIHAPADNDQGLFSRIQSTGTVTRLHLRDVDIAAGSNVGGVAGVNEGIVSRSSVTGTVSGSDHVGGLAGTVDGLIEQSYVLGQVNGSSDTGGLAGFLSLTSIVNESFAAANLTAMAPGTHIGGLIGGYDDGFNLNQISRSYWDASLYGTSAGGEGLITADMKRMSSFSGWNFGTDWGIIENTTYPMLRAGYAQVQLSGIEIGGAPLTGFSGGQGAYSIIRGTEGPLSVSPVLAATAQGSTVTIDGNGDLTQPVDLSAGDNEFELEVVSANGAWIGLYRLHIFADVLEPTIAAVLDPSSATPGNVNVEVVVDGTGSGIQLVKWAAGVQNEAYFGTLGTTIAGPSYSFTVDANGTYTVYARDEMGNEDVKTVMVTNIVTERPAIGLAYDPAPTNGAVEVTVTTVVYGEIDGNAIAALRWAPGSPDAAEFAGGTGTDIAGGKFTVSANGVYAVYVRDLVGLEQVTPFVVSAIVTERPSIIPAYDPTPASGPVEVTVTTVVYGESEGNAIAALRWARGSYAESDFSGGTLGEDILAASKFTIVSNGIYTLYARDIAGNETAVTVTVNHILTESSSSSPTCSADRCISLATGEGKSIQAEGLTVTIPANATNEALTIMLQNITSRYLSEERLIGMVYEITKTTAGRFLKPVTLEFRFDPDALGDNDRPAVFYYNEEERIWVELNGTKLTGENTVQGETDHFTKFAVLAVQKEAAKPDLEEPMASFSDIDDHWAQSPIMQAAAAGFVSGYEDGTFQPNRAVTRAEFTVMLAKALKLGKREETAFRDKETIPAWARQEVAAAVAAGILSGYDDGTFRPLGLIIRAEMVVMAAKAAGLPPYLGAETLFADNADIPAWSKPYAAAAYDAGLIMGKGGNRLAPSDSLTRAEAVIVLLGLLDASSRQ